MKKRTVRVIAVICVIAAFVILAVAGVQGGSASVLALLLVGGIVALGGVGIICTGMSRRQMQEDEQDSPVRIFPRLYNR